MAVPLLMRDAIVHLSSRLSIDVVCYDDGRRRRVGVRGRDRLNSGGIGMAVQVYGCNHVAIEVDNAEKAVAFYADVFNLEMLRGGEGAAWCKLGEHQFMAIFEVKELRPDRVKHFGIMVRDEAQINEVRKEFTQKYGLKLEPHFCCDFRDAWCNRIQAGVLFDDSLIL